MGKAERIYRERREDIRAAIGATGPGRPVIPLPPEVPSGPAEAGEERERRALHVPLGKIEPDPLQPRRRFDREGLEDLARSLRSRGQLELCRVVSLGGGRYRLVCGERRWRAAAIAGLPRLHCLVVDEAEAVEVRADQIVENEAREHLTAGDLAEAVHYQLAARGCSQRELAERLGISQATIAQAVAYRGLAGPVKAEVEAGALSPSAAVEIARLDDPAEQVVLAARAVELNLTRDQVRAEVKEALRGEGVSSGYSAPAPAVAPQGPPDRPGPDSPVSSGYSKRTPESTLMSGSSLPGPDYEGPAPAGWASPVVEVPSGAMPMARTIEVEPGVYLRFSRPTGGPITMFAMRDWAALATRQLNAAIAADRTPGKGGGR